MDLHRFYDAFGARDGAAMAASYHPDARFSDEVFVDLRGDEIGSMWRMLCERGRDLEIALVDARSDDRQGEARWEARYTYSATGRRVHNVVSARFRFESGLILDHRDSFDFWRWTRMALGPAGVVLGWTPFLRR